MASATRNQKRPDRSRGGAPKNFCDDDGEEEDKKQSVSKVWTQTALQQFDLWQSCEEKELEYIQETMYDRLNNYSMVEAGLEAWCRASYLVSDIEHEGMQMRLKLTHPDPDQFMPLPAGSEVRLYRSNNTQNRSRATFGSLTCAHQGKVLPQKDSDKMVITILTKGSQVMRGHKFDILVLEPENVCRSRLDTINRLRYGDQRVANPYLASVILGSMSDEPMHALDSIGMEPFLGKAKDQSTQSMFPTPTFRSEADVVAHYKEHLPQNMDIFNAAQQAAIMKSLGCWPLHILEGPPGTGKTRVLATIIDILHSAGKRVLVTAPTNEAVNNLMTACKEMKDQIVRSGDISKCLGIASERHIDEVVRKETDVADKLRNIDSKLHSAYARASYSETDEVKKLALEQTNLLWQGRRNLYKDNRVVFTTCFGCSSMNQWLNPGESRPQGKTVNNVADHKNDEENKYSSMFSNDNAAFDYCIVDEAGKVQCIDVLVGISISHLMIVAGDLCQLTPIVNSDFANKADYGRSLMKVEKDKYKFLVTLLNTQYRSNEKIMEWSSATFYEHRLLAHESVRDLQVCPELGPLTILSTETRPEFRESQPYNSMNIHETQDKSKGNWLEAALAVEYFNRKLKPLLDSKRSDVVCDSIFFISPYKKQIQALSQLVWLRNRDDRRIRVGTVDAFQGQEADIVIISMVRSNATNDVGFVKQKERLNVAITRARRHVTIVGDRATLVGSGSHHIEFLYRVLKKYGQSLTVLRVVDQNWIERQVEVAKLIVSETEKRRQKIFHATEEDNRPCSNVIFQLKDVIRQRPLDAKSPARLRHDVTSDEDPGATSDDDDDVSLSQASEKNMSNSISKTSRMPRMTHKTVSFSKIDDEFNTQQVSDASNSSVEEGAVAGLTRSKLQKQTRLATLKSRAKALNKDESVTEGQNDSNIQKNHRLADQSQPRAQLKAVDTENLSRESSRNECGKVHDSSSHHGRTVRPMENPQAPARIQANSNDSQSLTAPQQHELNANQAKSKSKTNVSYDSSYASEESSNSAPRKSKRKSESKRRLEAESLELRDTHSSVKHSTSHRRSSDRERSAKAISGNNTIEDDERRRRRKRRSESSDDSDVKIPLPRSCAKVPSTSNKSTSRKRADGVEPTTRSSRHHGSSDVHHRDRSDSQRHSRKHHTERTRSKENGSSGKRECTRQTRAENQAEEEQSSTSNTDLD